MVNRCRIKLKIRVKPSNALSEMFAGNCPCSKAILQRANDMAYIINAKRNRVGKKWNKKIGVMRARLEPAIKYLILRCSL